MPTLAGDHVQVFVDGYELTGDSNQLTIDDTRTTYDVTAFSDHVHNVIVGTRKSALTHAGYMNADAARAHPVLCGVSINNVVSTWLGQNAAPAHGDPVYSLLVQQGRYQVLPERGRAIPFQGVFASRDPVGGQWCASLGGVATFTNSFNSAHIDNGAATSSGGAAYLHVLTPAASDTYSLLIQGADNSGFSAGLVTHGTFTLNASANGSERLVLSGTLKRYIRFRAVRTGSAGNTVRVMVSFVRF